MKQRALGDLAVSQLCLGTMMFGTTTGEETAFALLDRFVEAGGTFIDTANCYQFWTVGGQGHESEELLGRWLRSRGLATGRGRAHVVIATKVGARPDPTRADLPWPDNREGLSTKVGLVTCASSSVIPICGRNLLAMTPSCRSRPPRCSTM